MRAAVSEIPQRQNLITVTLSQTGRPRPLPVELTRVDPNHDPAAWEAAGRQHFNDLAGTSVRHLRSALSSMRNVVRLTGLDTDTPRPPTPYSGQSAYQQIPTALINAFAMVNALGGQSFSYADENDGRVVRDIAPRRDAQRERSSQGWHEDLPWHMDGAFRPLAHQETDTICTLSPPPRWLVFAVIYDSPRVPLTFTALDDVTRRLPGHCIDALCQPEFEVESPDSVTQAQITRRVPILVPNPDGGYFSRFNQTKCHGTTTRAQAALERLTIVLQAPVLRQHVPFTAGDVIVLDNWTSLHMRSAYAPRWDGTDRWLVRIYAAPREWQGIPCQGRAARVWK